MAEFAGPFATGTNATFTQQFWQDFWGNFFTSGVVKTSKIVGAASSDLVVSAPGGSMNVTVGTGVAFANGFWYENTSALTLAIATAPGSGSRIDYVVCELNYSTNVVNCKVLTGTAGGSPSAPALTQTNSVWDIPLATVAVGTSVTSINSGNLTDQRVYTGVRMNPSFMGPGSGINADLLDGINSTGFAGTDGSVGRVIAVTGSQPTNATGQNLDLIAWY